MTAEEQADVTRTVHPERATVRCEVHHAATQPHILPVIALCVILPIPGDTEPWGVLPRPGPGVPRSA